MNYSILPIALLSAFGGAFVSGSATQDSVNAPLEFPAASPASSINQRIGVTDIEVAYGRPSMRGRKIFGGLEPYGAIWRTGANSATRVTFSTDVKLEGVDVPAGTYSLFSIPAAKEWTVILNGDANQFGAYGYDEDKDVARIKLKANTLKDPVETLAFGFTDLTTSSGTMYFEWETTRIAMSLTTDVVANLVPRIEAAMAADGPHPYLPAAMFYFENDVDLAKAAKWIDEAAKAQPNAFWITYRKGLILEKMGDKEGAVAAAEASLAMAAKSRGAIKDEYTRLNEVLIARCK